MIYITSDPHGDFRHIHTFCYANGTTTADLMIVLGDALVNYRGAKDVQIKEQLAQLPITFLFIKGNHDNRPENMPFYDTVPFCGGKAYVEHAYPNLLFAKDAEIYTLNGKRCMTVGGAYSLDAAQRQQTGEPWWADEQPTPAARKLTEFALEECGWQIDLMLTHTCPLKYAPMREFSKDFPWESVDTSTEGWMDTLEQKLDYGAWYCGHFHRSAVQDKLHIVYTEIQTLN